MTPIRREKNLRVNLISGKVTRLKDGVGGGFHSGGRSALSQSMGSEYELCRQSWMFRGCHLKAWKGKAFGLYLVSVDFHSRALALKRFKHVFGRLLSPSVIA